MSCSGNELRLKILRNNKSASGMYVLLIILFIFIVCRFRKVMRNKSRFEVTYNFLKMILATQRKTHIRKIGLKLINALLHNRSVFISNYIIDVKKKAVTIDDVIIYTS